LKMIARIFVLLAILAVCIASSPTAKSITASVKDTSVDGVDGLNLQWVAPFKFHDCVVGFKMGLANLRKAPEELFAKRSWSTLGDGTATVDADYNLASKVLNIATKWSSTKHGFELSAEGNTDDHLTMIGAETTQNWNGNRLTFGAAYDLLSKKLSGSGKINVDDTDVTLRYDNAERDPVLQVHHKLDDKNTVSPSISLKSGEMTYGLTRKLNGGHLDIDFHPGDKVLLEWTDNGANGVWSTKADIPVGNTAATKVSFSRDWNL